MGKFEDARAIAQGIGKSGDKLVASRVQQFLEQIDRQQQSYASQWNVVNDAARTEADAGANDAETTEVDRPGASLKHKHGHSHAKSSADTPPSPAEVKSLPAAPPVSVTSTHVYSMLGKITAVTCSSAPQIQITLLGSGIVMHLHATDIAKIEIKPAAGNAATANPPCAQFAGRRARISYQLASQKPWDAEIVSVELQASP